MKKLWDTYWGFTKPSILHQRELISIQWLRGIAVLLVFFYHVEDILNLLPGLSDVHTPWKLYGYAGPDLFFVISGFIMCYVTFALPFKPRDWLMRRILRIYPVFWMFACTAIAIWLYNPAMTMGTGEQSWGKVFKFFFLIPQPDMPLLFVAWTLEHEMVFYVLVFAIACLGGGARSVAAVMGVLSVLALLKAALTPAYTVLGFWDYHLFSLYMVQFFLGVMVFVSRGRITKLGVLFPLCFGIILFLLAGLYCKPAPLNHEHISRVLMFGFAFACILIGAINWECGISKMETQDGTVQKRPVLVKMGDASYSIYLSHPFLLSICGKIILAFGLSGAAAVMALLGGSILSLWGGCMIYRFIENPMHSASKMYLKTKYKKSESA